MPELRQDPVTRRWVVIATERGRRPDDFVQPPRSKAHPGQACPFCEGHEALTPPEVMAYRQGSAADTPGWSLRVVPNLYPAFGPDRGEWQPRTVGLYQAMSALGAHEVIINSPEHHQDLGQLPAERVERVIQGYLDRYRAHAANPLVRYIHIIVNHGPEAGASREHPHAQLFALPLVPSLLETELAGAKRYYLEKGGCAYCAMLRQELEAGERLVLEGEHFVALAPYASRVPFEVWLAPRRHSAFFKRMNSGEGRGLAEALTIVLGKLWAGLNDPPYNLFIHTAPLRREVAEFYHWHLEIWPKLSIAAGFELGTEMMINTVAPEAAAAFLRTVAAPVEVTLKG